MPVLTEGVQVALIGALVTMYGVTMTVLIPALLSIRKHSRAAAHSAAEANAQVSNDHDTNLREDNDKQHEAVMRLLRSTNRNLGALTRRVKRLESVNGITAPLPPTRKK
jgi:hypothetical protein